MQAFNLEEIKAKYKFNEETTLLHAVTTIIREQEKGKVTDPVETNTQLDFFDSLTLPSADNSK